MSPKEVLEFAHRQGLKYLDLRFSDISVSQHHVSYPIAELTEASFEDGFGIDAASMRSWAGTDEGDVLLLPDAATAFVDPFYSVPTLVMTCDVIDPITHQNYDRDPRFTARKAEQFLKNSGIGDLAHFGARAEFFVLDQVRFDQNPYSGFYFARFEEKDQDLTRLRAAMVDTMIRCGLNIEGHHREAGSGRQCAIDVAADTLLKSADNMLTCRYIVRNVACQRTKTATFMPKPRSGEKGSSMATGQSISKDGEPVFAGPCYAGLSRLGLHYIGGLLKHARALSAIVAPTTNSYQRVADLEPVHLSYSHRGPASACRVSNAAGKSIEFRPPDPSANPYLAFAAMLMAGLDGVVNQIDPGEPKDADGGDARPGRALPDSFDEALNCLEEDHDFLLRNDVFSEDLLDTFIEYKRSQESEAVRLRPHPYEFALYYDV